VILTYAITTSIGEVSYSDDNRFIRDLLQTCLKFRTSFKPNKTCRKTGSTETTFNQFLQDLGQVLSPVLVPVLVRAQVEQRHHHHHHHINDTP
jgi:hypothetical protein